MDVGIYPFPIPSVCSVDVRGKQYQNVGLSVTGMNKNANAGTSPVPGKEGSVRYRNEQKRRCRDQSCTRIRGPSPVRNVPVTECPGTGLRYGMPGMPMLVASTSMPMPSFALFCTLHLIIFHHFTVWLKTFSNCPQLLVKSSISKIKSPHNH